MIFMADIHVYGDFYVDVDAYQWILKRKVDRESKQEGKAGEKYEDSVLEGFYPTIASVCSSVVKKLVREGVAQGDLKTLMEVIERADELERNITNAVGTKV
jgi:uncharacterized protein (UPF0335 family)